MPSVRMAGRMGRVSARRTEAGVSAARSSQSGTLIEELFTGVTWSPGYVALLYYLVSIVTFRISGADIAAGICLIALLLRPEYLRISVPLRWFIALVLWAGLGVLSSSYPNVAFDSWIDLGKVLLVAVMLFSSIRTKEQLRFAMLVCVVSFLLFPFRGALVNYVSGYTLFGRALWNFAYSNPNDLAALAILFSSIAAAASSMYERRVIRLGLLGCALAFAFLVFMTQSRGAVVGMALAGTVILMGSKQRLRTAGGVVVVLLFAVIFAPSSVWNRLGGLSQLSVSSGMRGVDEEGSAEQRFQIAQVALAVAINQPLVGVGVGAYSEAHAQQAAMMRTELPLAPGKRDAHNSYLRVFAELGIPGLFCFLGMLIATALTAFRTIKSVALQPGSGDAARWLVCGLLAYCIAGIFGSFAYINILYVQICFISLLALAQSPAALRRKVMVR